MHKVRSNFASAAYKAVKPPEVHFIASSLGNWTVGTRRCSEAPGAGLPQQPRLSLILHDSPEIGY